MTRKLSYAKALLEATEQCMSADPSVYIMGLGVPDPGGVFGTTVGLQEKFGPKRVQDMPVAENGMTGIAIGSALQGMRPIMTHQRVDFMLLAMEQIVNQAAKWHYMFDGAMNVPLTIRIIVGRGWGQGPQHSQSLQSWFAHIPGLKVIMPFTPYDAKGMLVSAIEDNNPVVVLEHRWLYNIEGEVPEEKYSVPLDSARVARIGKDVTIAALSHMTYEAIRAAELLAARGIEAEVVDIRTLRPLDETTVLESVKKTGRMVAADTDWKMCGFASELVALASEQAFSDLKSAPIRITPPDYPLPTAPALSENYYPGAGEIAAAAMRTMGLEPDDALFEKNASVPHDVPDLSFTGPF